MAESRYDAFMSTIASTRLKIGMEVHVELATRSKMFTRSANVAHEEYADSPPNTLVDPVVAALPGVLPVMNKRAVEMSMMVGLAGGVWPGQRDIRRPPARFIKELHERCWIIHAGDCLCKRIGLQHT